MKKYRGDLPVLGFHDFNIKKKAVAVVGAVASATLGVQQQL